MVMEVPGFCFGVTDGQRALKSNLALIALWRLEFICSTGSVYRVMGLWERSLASLSLYLCFPSLPLSPPLPVVSVCRAGSFFIPHYSRIKDTVILPECGVHYRSSLPSRANVFNK